MLAARVGQRSPCSRMSGTSARVEPAPRRTALRDSRCLQCDFPSRLKHQREASRRESRCSRAWNLPLLVLGGNWGAIRAKMVRHLRARSRTPLFRLRRATPGKKLTHAWAQLRVGSAYDSPKFVTGWGRLRLTQNRLGNRPVYTPPLTVGLWSGSIFGSP